MSCWLDPLQWPTCAAIAGANAVGAVASIPDGIAHSFGDAATSAVTWLWTQVSNATTIDLTTPGIRGDLAITAAIAAVITVALFAIQVIGCALRGSFAGLGRSVRGLAIALVGAAFAIGATQLLLTAVDALANGVVQAAVGQNIQQIGAELVAVASLGVLGWAGLLLMSLVLLAAVAFIWCALMIRKMLIVVAAVFAPIAFSGATADITKGWVRRWIEFTVALIFSKLILVVIFLIGLSMVQGAGATGSTTNQVTNLAIGTLTLLLAGFAPWMAIKMVHFAGDAFHHVHAQAGAASVGAATVAAAPAKAASLYTGAKGLVAGRSVARSAGRTGSSRPAALAGTGMPRPSTTTGAASSAQPAVVAGSRRGGAVGQASAEQRNGAASVNGRPAPPGARSSRHSSVPATLPRADGDEESDETLTRTDPGRPVRPGPRPTGSPTASPAEQQAAPPAEPGIRQPSPPTQSTPRTRPVTRPSEPPADGQAGS